MKTTLLLIIFTFVSNTLYPQVFVEEKTRITLTNEVDLSVAGNFKNNGSIVGTGFMKLVGGNAQTISGDGILENFNIHKSGSQAEITGGHQDVFRIFEIHGGNFFPNAKITLKSSDTLTAQIGINTGGDIAGDMVIERFIPKSNRAHRYFSSPVATSESILKNLQEGQNNTGTNYPADNTDTIPGFGTHITGSKTGDNGFDATLTGNSSFFIWNADTQTWTSIDNTDINTLDKGDRFSLLTRGSRATSLSSNSAVGPETTLRLTGNPTILNFKKSIPIVSENSFILLGNPYHAAMDANLFLNRNEGLNTNFIYVYDPTLNSRGGYVTVELPGGTNLQGSEANQYIQPWQAVFIEATNIAPTTLNLTFKEEDKKVSEPQVGTLGLSTRIDLKLQHESETKDAISLKLGHGANSGIDQKDAKKLWNLDENLSIYSQGSYLSIEERSFPISKDTIMLHTYQKRKENYKLNLRTSNLHEAKIILKDFYLDKEYPLESNQDVVIDYQVAESEPEFRFGLIIGTETLSDEEFTSQNFQIYPNPARDILNIESISDYQHQLNFKVFSLLGQQITKGTLKNQDKVTVLDTSSFSEGVYLLVITDDNNLKETLKFIKI